MSITEATPLPTAETDTSLVGEELVVKGTGDDVAELTDDEVITGVERHYIAGWARFVLDAIPTSRTATSRNQQ